MLQDLSKRGSISLNQSLTPRIEGDVGLAFVLGGTSIRAIVASNSLARPKVDRMTFEEYGEQCRCTGATIDDTKAFMRSYVERVRSFLRQQRVHPKQIAAVGLSGAGLVSGSGIDASLTTVNAPVNFRNYRFLREFINEIRAQEGQSKSKHPHTLERVKEIVALNDGAAGVLGEYHHPDGLLRGGTGIFIIIGTGVGGQAIFRGELDPRIKEIGHTIWFNSETQKYEFHDIEEMAKEGLYHQGVWKAVPYPYSILEHKVGGAWLALSFLDELGTPPGQLHRQLAREICASARAHSAASAKDGAAAKLPPLPEEEVNSVYQELISLQLTDRKAWGARGRPGLIYELNKLIFSRNNGGYVYANYKFTENRDPANDLKRRLWKHKVNAMIQIGLAANHLYEKFGKPKIVLGSGIAEQLKNDENFQRIVGNFTADRELPTLKDAADIIQVSQIHSAEERETAGVFPQFFKDA